MSLTNFRTLGRSGLVVSPLALGTMTFGADRWGSAEQGSRAVFDAYVDAGGNVIDTADVYSGGRSEEMVGRFIEQRGLRDQLVLATKAGFSRERGNVNAGGNGAKNLYSALDRSLTRLRTDSVDLYWIHIWDMVTPAEEVLHTMDALVTSGKVRYVGISNAPAWYIAQLAVLAAERDRAVPIALQYEYSLVERHVEQEVLPAARALGMGLLSWSPLGGGLLTGKYRREEVAAKQGVGFALPDTSARTSTAQDAQSDGRLNGANPFGDTKFSDRNWEILEVVAAVAQELECTPAQVALRWSSQQPTVAGLIIGASRVSQLQENIAALDIALNADQLARLDAASAIVPTYPATVASPAINRMLFGGHAVTAWDAYR